jgi:hypothetical protein
VKEHGRGGQVEMSSVYYMIGREAGLNPNALADVRLEHKLSEQVKQINKQFAEDERIEKEQGKKGWEEYTFAKMKGEEPEAGGPENETPPLPEEPPPVRNSRESESKEKGKEKKDSGGKARKKKEPSER